MKNEKWYLIYVRPKQENRIALDLSKQRIDVYFPKIEGGYKKKGIVPLFPGYLFVHLNNKEEFFRCDAVRGVCNFVKFGRDFATLYQKDIDYIEQIVKNFTCVQVSNAFYERGAKCEFKSGLLKGQQCEVIQINGKRKIVVRLASIKQNVLVDVSVNDVEVLAS